MEKLFLAIWIFLGSLVGVHPHSTIPSIAKAVISPTATISQKQFACTYDLRLSASEEKLHNQKAIEILKQNCLWLMDTLSVNLQHKGKNNLVFSAAGAGCASCYDKTVYILSENKIIFQKDLDDPQIEVDNVNGQNLLAITVPVRKDNEPYCCSSQWKKTKYAWNEQKNQFSTVSQTP